MESYAPAELETLHEMIAEMPGWRPKGFGGSGLTAMFVAGKSTAMPHGFVLGHGVQPGDVLVSGAAARHRRLSLGAGADDGRRRADRRPARAFEAMLALQSRAIEVHGARRPGRPRSSSPFSSWPTSSATRPHLRHHVGHSIGLEGHEAPFLDRGDAAILEPGMVFTVEPGIYIPELGGFRHSDTVVITDDGSRVMTDYPRDLESLGHPGLTAEANRRELR